MEQPNFELPDDQQLVDDIVDDIIEDVYYWYDIATEQAYQDQDSPIPYLLADPDDDVSGEGNA